MLDSARSAEHTAVRGSVEPFTPPPTGPRVQIFVCARSADDLATQLEGWRAAGLDVQVRLCLAAASSPGGVAWAAEWRLPRSRSRAADMGVAAWCVLMSLPGVSLA